MSALSADVFSHSHIAVTASITGGIALALGAVVLRGPTRVLLAFSAAVVAGFTVYLWRASANMPQLNRDGLPSLSANDWLAPVLVYVTLGLVGSHSPEAAHRRFGWLRASVVVTAFAVNVITI